MTRELRVAGGCALCVIFLFAVRPALGIHPRLTFTELVHTADIAFVGTVAETTPRFGADEKMIFTDVRFQPVELIHQRTAVDEEAAGIVSLTFAGGQVGDRGMSVSGVPRFTVGERYLVFALHDGRTYANPLIGGIQGIFRLIADPQTGTEYPLTIGGAGIAAVSGGELQLTPRIESIEDGRVTRASGASTMTPPQGGPGQIPGISRADPEPQGILSLEELIVEIRRTLAGPLPRQPMLRGPRFGTAAVNPSGLSSKASFRAPSWLPDPGIGGAADCRADGKDARGTPLCACGYHDLFLTMEQVPSGWWDYSHNESAMWQWNQFMDIYRYTLDDGTWGHNGENEFGGWPSDADLWSTWGFLWGGGLAMTIQAWYGHVCAEIAETDVVFNPAYSWWQDFSDTLGYSSRILYRPVLMHELGHSWGMQRGSCIEDYSYDRLSVMHAYYSSVVEDGWGIHHWDAFAIRYMYFDQTPILFPKDVGVESYYASSGLHNATTDDVVYSTGDSITINNLTVENMSRLPVWNLRIRLWLSTNRVISEADHQMGTDWSWITFPAESYWTGSLTTTVPNAPTGAYYVGAIVTTDGDAYDQDDLSFNNRTFLPTTIRVQLTCTDDKYEVLGSGGSDDTCYGGSIPLDIPQSHAHCDRDWITFFALAGATYEIETHNLTGGADTVLELYSDCSTFLASDDDGGLGLASKITWMAVADGPLDVRVHEPGESYQPGYGYDIRVRCIANCTGGLIFADGFESGDLSAWSTSMPF